ncbi:hypothetical protein H072_6661 [Dactylellina haptotyla CBS 200.50]|uniref:Chromate ion transporter n=1 Tax=Dactylellina haptotyla (strain CBS 200.50) TaxID=1284197 RepID=S8BJT7_DACHA|nr:hypothetical protein H072_6661 [Dactylellina haptotyla CBS 200.50]
MACSLPRLSLADIKPELHDWIANEFRNPITQGHSGRASSTRLNVHLPDKWRDLLVANWHLGFTCFGGPPVHFQIFHAKFVDRLKWIDEQMFQELFALCQALPGPASTKMLFCINSLHGGFLIGFLSFCIWSLPGAIGMYGLSLGVARIGDTMPAPVYALLSGLNAATVGIIALAAVQLSEKAITDQFTRILVFVGGAVGMLYSALWFFPVLMLTGGLAAIVWDYKWLHSIVKKFKKPKNQNETSGEEIEQGTVTHDSPAQSTSSVIRRREDANAILPVSSPSSPTTSQAPAIEEKPLLTWRRGTLLIIAFFITFIIIMSLRGSLAAPPLAYSLFSNLYLAGTIIFGGGPVVIPLLREYIVSEGWVTSRDFLLGLALIQAFPGPNFNFAVYLGSLAALKTSIPKELGALLGFLGIFAPGIILAAGMMGLWRAIRKRRWAVSFLRGVNALATGLVFTAVYRLYQTGVIDADHTSGNALGVDPFWVAVTATSFVGGKGFGLEPFFAILLGGAMGMVWYGIVRA